MMSLNWSSLFWILLASRVLLFFAVGIGLWWEPPLAEVGFWRAFPDNIWLDGWGRWDSAWYMSIAQGGYIDPNAIDPERARNTAFFPAYPLATALLTPLVGHVFVAGLLVSNLSFFLAMYGLYRLVELKFDVEIATRTTLLLGMFPFAFFFSAVYSESLFLLCLVWALLMAERGNWLLAGIFAAGVSATRPMGILVLIPLGLIYLQHREFLWRKISWDVLYLGLGLVGLLGYMSFLWQRYGDPLEFVAVQSSADWAVKVRLFPLNETSRILFITSVGLALTLLLRNIRDSWPYALWSLVMCIVCLWKLHGFGRYLLVIFPCFIMLATLVRNTWVFWSLCGLFFTLMVYQAYRFSHWHWIA